MKITKYDHACFIVEHAGQSLIVDPGAYTTNLVIPENVVAVIITHEHADHFDEQHLQDIVSKNPEAVIVAHETITQRIPNLKTQAVVANEDTRIGEFQLEFYGGEHAVIYPEWPIIANLGVMINERVYYPGDSFTHPNREVEVLALPVSAPWMKISEAMDFLKAIKPQLAFPTHDAILSEVGKGLPDNMMPKIAKSVGTQYQRINDSPLEIN